MPRVEADWRPFAKSALLLARRGSLASVSARSASRLSALTNGVHAVHLCFYLKCCHGDLHTPGRDVGWKGLDLCMSLLGEANLESTRDVR